MAPIQPSQIARMAGSTDRDCGEGIGRIPSSGQQIEVRRPDHRVAGTAVEICPLVLGENKEHVRGAGDIITLFDAKLVGCPRVGFERPPV